MADTKQLEGQPKTGVAYKKKRLTAKFVSLFLIGFSLFENIKNFLQTSSISFTLQISNPKVSDAPQATCSFISFLTEHLLLEIFP